MRQRRKGAIEDLQYNSSSSSKLPQNETRGICGKVIKTLVLFLFALYCLPVLLTYFSSTVRHQLVFLNYLTNPYTNYNDLAEHGLKSSASNFYIDGKAGKLGVWHIPAESSTAINDGKPVILYMHGNAYSRAAKHRVATYKVLSALECHVIAHDYRGFGDSEGIPSEPGLIEDSLTVFQWILANANNGPVYLWGHSLGSGVAVAVSNILTERNVPVMGVILEAPFNNMREGAFNHPLSAPYRILPFFQDTLQEINGLFKSDEIITGIKYDILMVHDHGDQIVKLDLGKKLYEKAIKHKREYQTILFKELRGYSHTTIYLAPDLPEILRKFMKLEQIGKTNDNDSEKN